MATDRVGDIWNVPQFPQADFPTVSAEVWREAEHLMRGYTGKCRQACQLAKVSFQPGWLDAETGALANGIGAPVGQAVTVVLMRRRKQR